MPFHSVSGSGLAAISSQKQEIITEINGTLVSRPYHILSGGYYVSPEHARDLLGSESGTIDPGLNGLVNFKQILDSRKDTCLSATFEDGRIAFARIPGSQVNSAIQHIKIESYLLIRINVIIAGERANDLYAKNTVRLIFNNDSTVVGYEHQATVTDETFASIAKSGIESLSGSVEGVHGQRFHMNVETYPSDSKEFSNGSINRILRQKDDTRKNYIVVFPRVSFEELKKDFPTAYSEYARARSVSGYTMYVAQGSSFLVVTNNNSNGALLSTLAHEALHLLGVGDVGSNISSDYASAFDIMRPGLLKKTCFSNVHIYMILNALEKKELYQWDNRDVDLQRFVRVNGLHYS